MEESKQNQSHRSVLKKQILEIRNCGKANMFDLNAVQALASEREFYELVCFISDHPKQYIAFIISGNEETLTI